jgi:hypothetical protein
MAQVNPGQRSGGFVPYPQHGGMPSQQLPPQHSVVSAGQKRMRFYTEQAEAVKIALNGMNSMHQRPPDGVQPVGTGDSLSAAVDAANHHVNVKTVMQQQQQFTPMPTGGITIYLYWQGLISIYRKGIFL